MKVGITGHQERAGIRWSWVSEAIRAELAGRPKGTCALSSLAAGADQMFAEIALELGIELIAVVPVTNYERFFEGMALQNYRKLIKQAEIIELNWRGDPQHGFFEAGKYIVDNCDLLIAVWDGEKAEGPGGTGDIVQYAQQRGRAVVHINPCNEVITRV